MKEARAAAERVLAVSGLTEKQRVEKAFREALGRRPSRKEAAIALAAVRSPEQADAEQMSADARLAAWERLLQGLFGCIDFRYIE